MTDNELRVRLYAIADALKVIRDSLRGHGALGQMHLLELMQKDVSALASGAYKVIPTGGESDGGTV